MKRAPAGARTSISIVTQDWNLGLTLFQSYFELKNHWHSIYIMDPKNKTLTKQDIKDMESQVTKTLIKKEEKKIPNRKISMFQIAKRGRQV